MVDLGRRQCVHHKVNLLRERGKIITNCPESSRACRPRNHTSPTLAGAAGTVPSIIIPAADAPHEKHVAREQELEECPHRRERK